MVRRSVRWMLLVVVRRWRLGKKAELPRSGMVRGGLRFFVSLHRIVRAQRCG